MADPFDGLRSALADRYRVDREIGQGGAAVVFRAEDLKHRRPVAIKVLRPELTALLGPERFLAEIEVAARLSHPHILPLYDSGEAGGALYYVMPFVPGESLRERLDREKQLPLGDALRIAREVADALGYAHRLGIVHRDIKPENVLLQEGHAVVADFGIARALTVAGGERLTRSGVTLGTPAYMSPEQTTGSVQVDGRSDLYSLGCVLFEMLAGQLPFTAPTTEALVYQHLSVEPRPVSELRPTVPAAAARVVSRSLAKAAADRYRSATEMVEALERASAEAVPGTTSTVGPAAGSPRESTPGPERAPAKATSHRFPLRAALALAVVTLLLATAWWVWRVRARARAPVTPGAVAVLPFTVRGSEELGYLGEGMVDLLSTSLDGAAELRRVDPHALLGYLRRRGATDASPERGREVAQHFEAPLFVLGDVMQVGGRLRLQASLYRRARVQAPIAAASVEGEEREISSLVDQLAAKLVSEYTGQRGGRLARLAAVTTRSLPALKAYLEGEQRFRRGRYTQAAEAFRRAVELDSTFALGWYRYSVALGWRPGAGTGRLVRAAGERAVRYADRRTERDRSLLLSREALNAGRVVEAERHAQIIVGSYPDDAEAWGALGEALYHGNPFRGRSLVEARPALERAVYLDPEAAEPLNHLFEIAMKLGEVAKADSLMARLRSLGGETTDLLPYEVLMAAARDDAAALTRLMPRIDSASLAVPVLTAVYVAVLLEDLPDADRLATMVTRSAVNPGVRSYRASIAAAIRLGRGRWRAAQEILQASENEGDPGAVISSRAYLAGCPFLPLSEQDLRRERSAIEAWRVPASADAPVPGTFSFRHPQFHALARAYLVGLLDTRLGEDAAALARAKELEAMSAPREDPVLPRHLAAGLRARIAWRRGDPARALQLLEAIPIIARTGPPSGWRSRAHERYLRAELLHAVGRDEEALRWYETLVETEPFEVPHLAPSYLRRAEIEEKLGRHDAAARHYRRFLELRRGCDPEFQPEVDRARQRLERLTAARG